MLNLTRLFVFALLIFSLGVNAQHSGLSNSRHNSGKENNLLTAIWEEASTKQDKLEPRAQSHLPSSFRLLSVNTEAVEAILDMPLAIQYSFDLPLPDGDVERFELTPAQVMHPGLATKFPFIRTFSGRSVQNPSSIMKLVISPQEIHAFAFTEAGAVFVEKEKIGNKTYHISYFHKDKKTQRVYCGAEEPGIGVPDDIIESNRPRIIKPAMEFSKSNTVHALGSEVRTYRFGCTMPGEITTALGGATAAMIRVVNIVSDLNLLLETNLCMSLELIPDNDLLIFTDASTDPFSGVSLNTWMEENRLYMVNTIGAANFDLGHVISPLNGGVAYVGVTCFDNYKGGGTSPNSIETIAHEIGHQLGASHTFNYCNSTGGGYEPGSGNTSMSYYGLCPGNNMPGGELVQYHAYSFEQITEYRNGYGSNCGNVTMTGNTPPVVSVPASGFTIPVSTPFKLEGTVNDDSPTPALTYLWEQMDLGSNSTPPYNPTGNAPIFRSYPYSNSPSRTFPELQKIINGTADVGEILPTYNRELNFRYMVHDNHPGGGGVDYGEIMFFADESAGPFEVAVPNGPVTVWSPGQTRTVEWIVANTDLAPVSCGIVNILISYDGGYTYPDTLATGVPNDGSHDVVVPSTPGTQTRVRVEAADNIFFDVSDQDFEIVPSTVHDFMLEVSPASQKVCVASSSSVNFEIETFAMGSFTNSLDLTVSGLPSGATVSVSSSVNASSSSTLTISNLNAVSPGQYPITLSATETGGGISHSEEVYLIVSGVNETLPGKAMSFDGDEQVSIPNTGNDYQFGSDRNFSFDLWMRSTSTANTDVMLAKKDWSWTLFAGWLVDLRFGKPRFIIADGNDREILQASNTYNDGEWHHIAGTLNRNGQDVMRLYVDGVLVDEDNSFTVGSISNDEIISMGSDSNNDYNFEGRIEEVRIWNKALDIIEIRELMHLVTDACDPDLISCWQFNGNDVNVLDKAGHYNGTLNGAMRVTSSCPIGPGDVNTASEVAGVVIFPEAEVGANYTNQAGASVTTTRIDLTPYGNGGIDPMASILDNQYWVLNRFEQIGPLSAALTFGLSEDVSLANAANPAVFSLYSRDFNADGSWTFLANAISADAINNTVTFNDIQQYGQFLITRTLNFLPLDLIDFDVQPLDLSIKLKWTTAFEEDVAGFEIRRSVNGNDPWLMIGWVDAKNSSEQQQYSFSDKDILLNTDYYYKLKIHDLDGSYFYSEIKSARVEGQGEVRFFPNPNTGILQVQALLNRSQRIDIDLFDVSGNLVFSKALEISTEQTHSVIIGDILPAGVYLGRATIGENVFLQKIILIKEE
ncbi:MAG: reprolysin-like metallopeptidase [Bacteroidota bacterium]